MCVHAHKCAHSYTGEEEVSRVRSQWSLCVLMLSSAAFFPEPLSLPTQCTLPEPPLRDHPVLGAGGMGRMRPERHLRTSQTDSPPLGPNVHETRWELMLLSTSYTLSGCSAFRTLCLIDTCLQGDAICRPILQVRETEACRGRVPCPRSDSW